MKHRTIMTVSLVALLVPASTHAADYKAPRASDGKPELQGVWTNSSLTRLTRSSDLPNLVLTPEEAEAAAAGNFHNVRAAADQELSDGERGAPEKLKNLPGVGNYNAFWVDPGSRYSEVNGEIRSSWIVDPPDGQMPMTPELRETLTEQRRIRMQREGPEAMSLGERCLLGFGGTGGPPMLNVLYNNYYEIVQTADYVMILTEMVHDVRVIKIGGEHLGPGGGMWLGDSIGHWEGDTLVVETRNFHPERALNGPFYFSDAARVEERFTRVSDEQIYYEFTVDDPKHYQQPIRGEMSFTSGGDDKIYEYACHEGNYGLGGILRGARFEESQPTGITGGESGDEQAADSDV